MKHETLAEAERLFYADGRNDGAWNIELEPSDIRDHSADHIVARERRAAVRDMRRMSAWEAARDHASTNREARRLFKAYLDGQGAGLRYQIKRFKWDVDENERWEKAAASEHKGR